MTVEENTEIEEETERAAAGICDISIKSNLSLKFSSEYL